MSRINYRGHVGRRDYPINTVAPTLSGSAISAQTLTGTNGTWTSSESTITGYAYQWQTADAPDFSTWTDLSGATSSTILLAAGQISKKLRLGVAAINGDGGGTRFVYTAPTAIVQDAPAIPLAIHGTPVTAANQGDAATFTVSFDGGTGAYTPSLINPPSGSSVTLLSSGNQATVTLGTAASGSFGGVSVRVSDGSSIVDLTPFTFTVNSISGIQTVIPGTGWTGLTTTVNGVDITAARGSPSAVGYNFKPTCYFEEPAFFDIDSPYILWIHARHTGTLADYNTYGNPTFGIEKLTVAADGGSWLTITAQYNAAENFWGFPVRIDPAKWADGYPTKGTSSVRTLRIVAWPRNGTPRILQTEAPDYYKSFRFTTNANGTFTRSKRYFGANGNSANSGLDKDHPKPTMEEAAATFSPDTANHRDWGDLELVCTGGTSLNFNLSTARTTTVRSMKLSALPGLTSSDCIFTSQGTSGMNTALQHISGVGLNFVVNCPTGAYLYFENPALDGGSANLSADVTFHSTKATLIYVKGGSITNYGNAFRGTTTAVDVAVGKITKNWIQNVLVSRNVTLSVLPPVGGVHPDTFQYYRSDKINVAGGGWFAGGIAINCTVASADAQGPFFKDNNYVSGIFMEGCNFAISAGASRNTFYIGGNTTPNYPYTILQNSMFWDCTFSPGTVDRGGGRCDNVIWKNVHVPGSAPTNCLVYEAAH